MKLNTSFPRRTRLYALLFSLVLCLTACSAPSDPSGTLSEFSRDGNAFCYPDAQWGMTPSELQKETGGLATQPDGDGARTRLMISAVQQSESSVAVSLDVSLLPNA